MGRSLPLFLTRAAGMLIAAMLLFSVFSHAHAQTSNNPAGDNYGLKRFSGDNYDTIPPGAGIPSPPSPQGNAQIPGLAVSGNGTYSTLNGGAPENYRFAPPPAQTGLATQAPASNEPYGYKPLPAAPQYPQSATTASANANAYYQPAYASPASYDYILGAGDKLRLTVFGESDLSGEFTIDGSGFARLPLIGQVRASGYTSQQLEAVIGSALAQGYLKSPRVSVEVVTYRPFYIIGAVNRPGQYAYVDHMNALTAVALAGGFTNGAVESVVFVRREGSNQEVEVPADRTTGIYPGDVVKVHNTIFTDTMNLFAPFSGVAASAATAAVIQ